MQKNLKDDKFYKEIVEDLNERMSTHCNSMCASADEVRIAYLICLIEDMRRKGVQQ